MDNLHQNLIKHESWPLVVELQEWKFLKHNTTSKKKLKYLKLDISIKNYFNLYAFDIYTVEKIIALRYCAV